MTRSYNNTLLFETALDSITVNNTVLNHVATSLFEPSLLVVEEECGTLLGLELPISFRVQGCVELSTGLKITPARLTDLISSGEETVNVRSVSTCISPGGVCRACLAATEQNKTIPAVGYTYKYSPRVQLDSTEAILFNGNTTLTLPYSQNQFDEIYVYINGALVNSSQYTVSENIITFLNPAVTDTIIVFKYFVYSRQEYFQWLAKTFAGSLLGIRPIFSRLLPVKKDTLINHIIEPDLEFLIKQLKTSTIGGEDAVVYIDSIRDPLEKAIFTCLLSSIFNNP